MGHDATKAYICLALAATGTPLYRTDTYLLHNMIKPRKGQQLFLPGPGLMKSGYVPMTAMKKSTKALGNEASEDDAKRFTLDLRNWI